MNFDYKGFQAIAGQLIAYNGFKAYYKDDSRFLAASDPATPVGMTLQYVGTIDYGVQTVPLVGVIQTWRTELYVDYIVQLGHGDTGYSGETLTLDDAWYAYAQDTSIQLCNRLIQFCHNPVFAPPAPVIGDQFGFWRLVFSSFDKPRMVGSQKVFLRGHIFWDFYPF